MPRIIRAALATASCVAALAGGAIPAHAGEAKPRAATATSSFVQLQAAHSGKCLTLAQGSLGNGANAVQSTCVDGLANQLFELVPTDSAAFEVRAEHSGKCLEVENGGTKAGSNVQQWWCTDGPQQRWKVIMVEIADGLYELRPTHALDRCLDISNASLEDGANAQSWYCNGSPAQRWRILPAKP
ncbi:RICIN domain-containing protein [Streptomyces varsoviensis]|uniref:RICIN domain-containing protein n=1 Tax=Streptomyces varsoviensis TaxID=67373 RepID=UPI000997A201|nr:RICIN domain-containing protein [Streptomyces varsoviensis]